MFKRILTAGLLFGMAATAPPAFAANCAPRDVIVTRLSDKYSESLTGGGLQAVRGTKALVEVWTSPETGTFTVILTTPEGVSCIVAAGSDWVQHSAPLKVEDIPS